MEGLQLMSGEPTRPVCFTILCLPGLRGRETNMSTKYVKPVKLRLHRMRLSILWCSCLRSAVSSLFMSMFPKGRNVVKQWLASRNIKTSSSPIMTWSYREQNMWCLPNRWNLLYLPVHSAPWSDSISATNAPGHTSTAQIPIQPLWTWSIMVSHGDHVWKIPVRETAEWDICLPKAQLRPQWMMES